VNSGLTRFWRWPLFAALSVVAGCSFFTSKGTSSNSDTPVRLAILATAYSGPQDSLPCLFCPSELKPKPTASAVDARLLTSFIYERIARHPRFHVVDHLLSSDSGQSMNEVADELDRIGSADAMVVSELIDLRRRKGSVDDPDAVAGVTFWMGLVEVGSHRLLWQARFDEDEKARGWFGATLSLVRQGYRQRWSTAEEFLGKGVAGLVDDMVDDITD